MGRDSLENECKRDELYVNQRLYMNQRKCFDVNRKGKIMILKLRSLEKIVITILRKELHLKPDIAS